jgi:hypothetical protein
LFALGLGEMLADCRMLAGRVEHKPVALAAIVFVVFFVWLDEVHGDGVADA